MSKQKKKGSRRIKIDTPAASGDVQEVESEESVKGTTPAGKKSKREIELDAERTSDLELVSFLDVKFKDGESTDEEPPETPDDPAKQDTDPPTGEAEAEAAPVETQDGIDEPREEQKTEDTAQPDAEPTPAPASPEGAEPAVNGGGNGRAETNPFQAFSPAGDDEPESKAVPAGFDNELEVPMVAQGEYEDLLKRYISLVADFDNYKKRVIREKDDIRQFGIEDLTKELLMVVDNFERALTHSDTSDNIESIREGLQLVQRQFAGVLEKFGVRPIEIANGDRFDPRFHQAIEQVETNDITPGLVLNEILKGYTIMDKLLRPSLVAVSMHKSGAEPGESDAED